MAKEGLRVLFIEDNPDDVELEVLELERSGLELEWSRVDSEAALRSKLPSWKPDVILSDHSMPNFDGLAALEIVRQTAPEIPLIFVSGTIGEESAIESIRLGAIDYVLKDNLKRLSTSVRRAVKESIERRRASEMEKEKSRLVAILENTSDLVIIANPDWSIFYINQGAKTLLGLNDVRANLLVNNLHAPWSWDFMESELDATIKNGGSWQGESAYVSEDGTEIPVSQVVITHLNDAGAVEYYSFLARDIRALKDYEKKVQYLANFHPLTGMPNRSLLSDRGDQAISYSDKSKGSLAVLIIDIDRFKLVNDGYGIETGDQLLKMFGARLQSMARSRDTVAHLNANCFAILATEFTSPHDVITVVRKIQTSQSKPFMIDDKALSITASIGVSMYPRDGKDFSELFQKADLAMHRSKEKGDGSYQFYAAEMTQRASDRISLEQDLGQAIAKGNLELYYQPQVLISNGKMVGMEALLRWNHPERGSVPPDTFIPIAESSDLILGIGEWVLKEACKQIMEWNVQFGRKLRIAVNVSPRQFRSKGFIEMVKIVLNDSKTPPECLEIELTESTLIKDHDETVRILTQLNQAGVRIALDDFGTGYSNLSYLSRLPIDCLKIDRAFVNRSQIDENDAEIVKAVISLAQSLRLSVTAEGIETGEQLSFLRRLNCDEGQGYFFSKPKKKTELLEYLMSDSITLIKDKPAAFDNMRTPK